MKTVSFSSLQCFVQSMRTVERSLRQFAPLGWTLYEGHSPWQEHCWPSPGLEKKNTRTIHNTHKTLMCLQNYLIFYLEDISPLSSFIALYMTEVGKQRQMRPSWTLRAGSVYGLTLARQQSPKSPFPEAPVPSPKPASSIRRLLLPY